MLETTFYIFQVYEEKITNKYFLHQERGEYFLCNSFIEKEI